MFDKIFNIFIIFVSFLVITSTTKIKLLFRKIYKINENIVIKKDFNETQLDFFCPSSPPD